MKWSNQCCRTRLEIEHWHLNPSIPGHTQNTDVANQRAKGKAQNTQVKKQLLPEPESTDSDGKGQGAAETE